MKRSVSIPIITTKLRAPVVSDLIERPGLIDALKPSPEIQLTLVTGGAGYGKTSVLARLVSEIGLPVVWYKLDASDRDPVQFLAYLINGTQQAAPGLVDNLSLMLAGAGAQAYREKERLFRAFLAQLSCYAGEGLLYVLDDYHEVEKSRDIPALTELLIDLAPPTVHVFIASREEPRLPLGRLRARGRLRWLRADDLRFSPTEIEELFVRQGMTLAGADLQAMDQVSEGWAASLVLLREAWRRREREERAEILARGAFGPALGEFLSEEVFERQSLDMREFLLATSVADPLLPEMCDAVLEKKNSVSYLETACSEHLLTSRLEGPEPAYRYHPLFRDFLQERLSSEGTALFDLHRRWGKAWEVRNEHVQAIKHFLGAEDDRAFELIEEVGEDYLDRGQAETVEYWLGRAAQETVSRRPGLRYLQGLTLLRLGRFGESIRALDLATEAFLANGDRGRAYESRHLSSHTSLTLGDWKPAVQGCRDALELAPDARARIRSRTLLGCSYLFLCDWDQAIENWNTAIEEAEDGHSKEKARAVGFLATLHEWQGDYVRAGKLVREAVHLLEGTADVFHYARLLNNYVLYLGVRGAQRRALRLGRNCLALIEENFFVHEKADILDTLGQIELSAGVAAGLPKLEESLELMRAYGDPIGEAITLGSLGLYLRREGDLERASGLLDLAYRLLGGGDPPFHYALALVELARVQYLKGDAKRADQLRSQAQELCDRHSFRHVGFRMELHRAQEALSEGRADEAAGRLQDSLRLARRYQYNDYLIQEGRRAPALLAFAFEHGIETRYLCFLFERMGQAVLLRLPGLTRGAGPEQKLVLIKLLARLPSDTAATALKRYLRDPDAAVRQAAREAYTAAVPRSAGFRVGGEAALKTLTGREVEILAVVARGLSNRQVAEKLFLSEETVKTHLKRIYRKLQVSSRGELAALAGQLEKSANPPEARHSKRTDQA